jgi:hypothetical protein
VPRCPRCKWSDLVRGSNSTAEVTFYECANCVWAFAQRPGESLHDGWGSPISVALYLQIFERTPETTGRDAALHLFRTRHDLVAWLIHEIRRELKCPTQKVSEIHQFVCKDEAKLRQHLGDLADRLVALEEDASRDQRRGASAPATAPEEPPAE